jgi:hypothetical protein
MTAAIVAPPELTDDGYTALPSLVWLVFGSKMKRWLGASLPSGLWRCARAPRWLVTTTHFLHVPVMSSGCSNTSPVLKSGVR